VKAYIAGPLFDDGERWWIERVEQTVVSAGFDTFLPHRDNPPKDESNVAEIFANDRRGIDESDVVVASLNGIITDDGTAWELGYAFALGKPIIGLHTDWRRRFDHETVNLMIECSLTALVHSLEEVPGALRELFGDAPS
jgi:nucleoside 2-deoxyribosyltransferase